MADDAPTFGLKEYYQRLGINLDPKATPLSLEALTKIVLAHQRAIPFENIDSVLGKQVNLCC